VSGSPPYQYALWHGEKECKYGEVGIIVARVVSELDKDTIWWCGYIPRADLPKVNPQQEIGHEEKTDLMKYDLAAEHARYRVNTHGQAIVGTALLLGYSPDKLPCLLKTHFPQ